MTLRILQVGPEQLTELHALPAALPPGGFVWLGCQRETFDARLPELQAALQRWAGGTLVDLHVSDLLNQSLPSHFDATSWYDLMVFRRVAAGSAASGSVGQALAAVDTSAVGFAVFDRVLLTVHHATASTREHFAQRLAALSGPAKGVEARSASRLPASPDDLMLRMVNHMVDSFLDLRRLLTRQFGELQRQLLDPRSRFDDWHVLLEARNTLAMLEDSCEDQHSAVTEWIDALDECPLDEHRPGAARTRPAAGALARRARAHRTCARPCAAARRVGRSRGAAALLGPGPPHQRHHAHADGADGGLPAAEPDDRLLRHELRFTAADPLQHRLWVTLALMGVLGRGAVAYFWRKRYLDTR